ncbi:MAG TPA: GH3 auxin-responsive promoter family protein [Oculatellaceae cyanobacterium]
MFRPLLYKAFAALGSREVSAIEAASRRTRLAQQEHLLGVLSANADTVYGREHKFSSIRSIADFQNSVPVNDYDVLQPYIEKAADGQNSILTAESPFMFATTSGTSGARKLIPVTRSYVREFRRASVVSGFNLLKHFPALSKGVALTVFSPAEDSRTAAGIPCGAISGRLYLEEPPLIKRYVSPIPYDVFVIADYESRYYTLLKCALGLPVSSIYTLNPSTIMIIAKRLELYAERLVKDVHDGTLSPPGPLSASIRAAVSSFNRPDPARAKELTRLLESNSFVPPKVWPGLSMISCWTKAAASFYLQDFPKYFGNVPVCDITYGASEGRGTVCLSPDQQMLAIRSHFFEFIEEADIDKSPPRVRIADELEIGRSYYILFTTSSGLYRYNINDIVKVVGWHNNAPLLEFLHKGGNISSFTGEKITESHVTKAVLSASNKLGLRTQFFTVVPHFRPEPHYELLIEYIANEGSNITLDELSNVADRCLGEENIEYQAKRESNRLSPIIIRPLRPGSYEYIRKTLVAGGTPDAQIKVSHLNPKANILQLLDSYQNGELASSLST